MAENGFKITYSRKKFGHIYNIREYQLKVKHLRLFQTVLLTALHQHYPLMIIAMAIDRNVLLSISLIYFVLKSALFARSE